MVGLPRIDLGGSWGGVAIGSSNDKEKDRSLPNDARNTPSNAPTNAPMFPPHSDCFYSLMDFLVPSISNTAALTDRETPQYAALDWLANVDKAMMDLETTPEYIVLERYAVVLLLMTRLAQTWDSYNY